MTTATLFQIEITATADVLADNLTLAQAEQEVNKQELEDKDNGTYEANYYTIKAM